MSFFNNSSGRGGFLSNLPVAVKNIIIINVVMMVATFVRYNLMNSTFALYFPASPFFKIWQPITYMFMNGDFFHLFFNMYTLLIFGTVLERVWGPKKFLLFYFVTGIGAALVHMGVQWIQYENALTAAGLTAADASLWADQIAQSVKAGAQSVPDWSVTLFVPTVGASGAIYGILMGYAILYPDSIMRLIFPPVALKAKWFVLIFAGLELILGITSTGAGIAHFAHLGGLIFGFILLMYWKKTRKLYGTY